MKNRLVKLIDKILLRKRAVIESVNDHLKNLCEAKDAPPPVKLNILDLFIQLDGWFSSLHLSTSKTFT